MSNSPSITAADPSPVHESRLTRFALWGLQFVLASMFLLAGGSKLAGAAAMVAMFDAIDVGQWFRYATGSIEVVSALALLVPSLAAFGAVALVATMSGAIATHLFIIGGSPGVPVFLLIGSLVIAWARREQLQSLSAVLNRRIS